MIDLGHGVTYFENAQIMIMWRSVSSYQLLKLTREFFDDIDLVLVFAKGSETLYPVKDRTGNLNSYRSQLQTIFHEFEIKGTSCLTLGVNELVYWRLTVGF
jgi:hypothetical protein